METIDKKASESGSALEPFMAFSSDSRMDVEEVALFKEKLEQFKDYRTLSIREQMLQRNYKLKPKGDKK